MMYTIPAPKKPGLYTSLPLALRKKLARRSSGGRNPDGATTVPALADIRGTCSAILLEETHDRCDGLCLGLTAGFVAHPKLWAVFGSVLSSVGGSLGNWDSFGTMLVSFGPQKTVPKRQFSCIECCKGRGRPRLCLQLLVHRGQHRLVHVQPGRRSLKNDRSLAHTFSIGSR